MKDEAAITEPPTILYSYLKVAMYLEFSLLLLFYSYPSFLTRQLFCFCFLVFLFLDMQSSFSLGKIVHTHARPQHLVYLHVRNSRCYLPYQQRPSPPRRPPNTIKSEHGHLPTVVSKDGLHPLKGFRIRQTKDWGWSKSRDWAARHPKLVRGFGIIVFGTISFFYFHLQPVPITGRRQLEYVPKWLERRYEDIARQEDDESWKEIANCSLGSDHPAL